MKGETTVQYLQNDMKVINVSLEIVNKILKLCPVCEERSTIKTKRQRQSQTPLVITSNHFGHRGQLDLVDMQSSKDTEGEGYKHLFHYQVSVLQALESLVFWPFAVEAFGRPGKDAISFLRSLAPADPELRSAALGSAWQALSVVLQMENAELLLAAAWGGGGVRRRARR